MALAQDAIEIPALGRSFQLGMLYDCCKDAVIPGITLWDSNALQEHLITKPQPKTATIIIASDSLDDKASALDISASLKASFLGGLIDVRGSAEYLHDTKKSKKQARVTVLYKTTTKYEQLTMDHLGIQNISYPNVFDHRTATHVVTAILHGAQAFFVFDQEVSSTEKVKDIQGSLQLTVKKMISVTGEAGVRLDKVEREKALTFSCMFHGDFSLEKNPVTFQDAMKVYETLPKMLGEGGEKAVPMRVWLYPLTKLDNKAAKMVREISLALIFQAQEILEELNEIEMQSNDVAYSADKFPEIKKKIQHFKNLLKQHKQTFQTQLARMLPSIRGGIEKEETLRDILKSMKKSPFNSQRLCEFLETKEREINHVNFYLNSISEEKCMLSKTKLEKIALDPQNVHVVSFTFTSLHEEEPFLLSLQDWLKEQESDKSTRSPPEVKKGLAWFEEEDSICNARQAAKSMKDFFSVNQSNENVCFAVASVPDVDTPGASIYLYEDGELVSKNFELPSKPLPFLISELRHDSIQLKFQPAEHGKATISSYLVEYKVAGEEKWKTVRTEDARETFLLKDLPPNTEYQFQYAACCKVGLSISSDLSPPIKTLPTSPPEKLRIDNVASSVVEGHQELEAVLGRPPRPKVEQVHPNRFQISIDPVVIGKPSVSRYQVEYRIAGDNWKSLDAKDAQDQFTLEDVHPNLQYQFRCAAVTPGGLGQWSKKCWVISRPTGLEMAGSIRGPERRIVLVGNSGSGISATGNTILGSKVFALGGLPLGSVTQACQKEETQLKGRKVVVVDTPGFFHTDHPVKVTAAEVSKCMKFCCPGPHVILRVMRPTRFSQKETYVAQQIKEVFGLKAKNYTILLFTCRDSLEGRSLENCISAQDKSLKEYIAECGNRYLAFDNEAEGEEREAQVDKLMAMIDDLVETNRDAPCYTEDMMNVSKRCKF